MNCRDLNNKKINENIKKYLRICKYIFIIYRDDLYSCKSNTYLNINKWLNVYKKYKSDVLESFVIIIKNIVDIYNNINNRFESKENIEKYIEHTNMFYYNNHRGLSTKRMSIINDKVNYLSDLSNKHDLDILKLNYFENIRCLCKFNFKMLNENKINKLFDKI